MSNFCLELYSSYLFGYTTSNHFSLSFEAYNSLLLSLHCNSLFFISFVYTKLFYQQWSSQSSIEHSLITLNFVFFFRSFYDMYLSLYYKCELLTHEELSMDAPKSSDFFPRTLLSTQFLLFLCRMFLFQRMHWCFLVDSLYSSMINPSPGSLLGVFAEHFDNISYFCPQTSRYRSL